MTSSYHEPVLTQEVIDALNITPGKRYIDGTLGGGGHTALILKRGGIVLGIDTDTDAIQEARARLIRDFPSLVEGKDWTIVQGNFKDLDTIAKSHGFDQVDGILLDIGVSSHQLDTPSRGFSYRFADAPLDSRLNQKEGETAAELIQRSSEEELYEIFTTFGEEERSRAVSTALVRARQVKRITTVGDVVEVITAAGIGKGEIYGVASRIFQALRIAINDELGALKIAIAKAHGLLLPKGRLAVISFHSLEDRIVKRMMREALWSQVTTKPLTASQDELEKNKRSRSAKLRVVEKI
jgi:16S rRNA (cytosine1402-N4)-methyltransferase